MREEIIHNETLRYDDEHNQIEEMYRNGFIPYNMKIDMQEKARQKAIHHITAINKYFDEQGE